MLAMQDHEKDYFTSDTSPSLLPTDWVLEGTFASADGTEMHGSAPEATTALPG
jgi:hypothetical protein